MNQISYTFLIIFQVSIILIDFFIIKISFDWGKDETAIGKTFILLISSSLSLVCILTFLAVLQMLLNNS
ncbi:hypothetical protein Lbuc_1457 [Lentilactobacillus buchneri NRRL B-30929]|uniref:Uncharacterized protein n=1 Tax=Secundilactobacillus collinoides TaxID=33960 RepID=A0A166GAI7_SECCO|nr:hypothetical protein Lbuc_1457 [Lentilactobacillus buchneri NRRL B-30929]KZL37735.1 hypothetical protein TY91_12410 [Secundilactobacillus collinoides]